MPDVALEALPWKNQVELFKKKTNVTTEKWNSLYGEAHDTSFTVAGMTKVSMLESTHELMNEAVAGQITFEEFQKQFDDLASGWKGKNNWRARIIYETNIRTSYAAGLEDVLTKPSTLEKYPYWQYIHSHASIVPRQLHLSWDKLVIPANSPWWQTHTPPCGFGCKCTKKAISEEMLAELKLSPVSPPDNGTYTYIDPKGVKHVIPNGIDPGWDYTPGQKIRKMQEMLDEKILAMNDKKSMEASKKYLAAVSYSNKQINEIRNRYSYQLEESRWEQMTETQKKQLIASINKDIASRQSAKVFVEEGQREAFKLARETKNPEISRQILADLLGIPKYSGNIP